MSRREFQLIDGTASKFWSITLEGLAHTVHYGRIGTQGQESRKEFATDLDAKTSHDKLVAEKVKKGYIEVAVAGANAETGDGGNPETPPPAPAAPRSKAKSKPTPKTNAKIENEAEDRAAELEATSAGEPQLLPPTIAPAPTVERSIDLEPKERFLNPGWTGPPLPRPEPGPFDLDQAIKAFGKVATSQWSHLWKWNKAAIPSVMSREEALFWLSAMTFAKSDQTPSQVLARLRADHKGDGRGPSFADVLKLMDHGNVRPPGDIVVPLVTLFGLDAFLDSLGRPTKGYAHSFCESNQHLLDGFRRHILPYLSTTERESLRDRLRAGLGAPALPGDYYSSFPITWYFAATLGLHDEVATLVRLIPDDHYKDDSEPWNDHYQRPQLLVLGLGDPKRIEAEWRRLSLVHKVSGDVLAWIATTGWSALDLVRDSLLPQTNKEVAAELLDELSRVKAPEAAPVMLELMLGSKAPKGARAWLEENPGHAISGLIPVAAGRGKLADAALELLRDRKKKGYADFIRECLTNATPEVADKIKREVLDRVELVRIPLDDATTPEPIRAALKEAAKLKAPAWVNPDGLPFVLVGDRVLNDEQRRAFLGALARSTLAAPHPLVAAIRAQGDRASLDAFAWSLFEQWQTEGTPSREKWAMLALGLIGSDGSALKLTPLVRAWPGESQHQRAVVGLECLRAIGTDVAMMQLNGVAQKLSFKGLKAKASEMMEAIAADRNLTRAQLEDRIVPDCDLDDRGSRIFDFGPRQFRFALGTEMKPMVRDPDGKLKADLPKPGAKDDPALATAAVAAWKLLKKQVKEVARVQAERLEQAMVTGRRWTPADFEALLVRHPLMMNLVRLVLWGGYDASGKLVATFRVTEERDYADVNESTCTLEGMATVGVVHPLHMADAERSAWGEIFGDYEIMPPFPQLGRPIHRLEPDELDGTDLTRNKGLKVPAITLVGILDRHGWARGIPEDAGIFHEHSKGFEGANVTAVIQYDGIPIGAMVDWDDQEVDRCFFLPGLYTPSMYPDHKKKLALKTIDPVVISEVLGTLGALAAKAK